MKVYIVVSDTGFVEIDAYRTLKEAQKKIKSCREECLADSAYYTGDIEITLKREVADGMSIIDEPNEFWYDCNMDYEGISEHYYIVEKEI